jgi:hypothetical protein
MELVCEKTREIEIVSDERNKSWCSRIILLMWK